MQYFLKVKLEPNAKQLNSENTSELEEFFAKLLSQAAHESGGELFIQESPGAMYRAPVWPSAPEFIVTLGSAGVFTALFQVLSKFLEKHKDREITITREGREITIKGHSFQEERKLLHELIPELIVAEQNKQANKLSKKKKDN